MNARLGVPDIGSLTVAGTDTSLVTGAGCADFRTNPSMRESQRPTGWRGSDDGSAPGPPVASNGAPGRGPDLRSTNPPDSSCARCVTRRSASSGVHTGEGGSMPCPSLSTAVFAPTGSPGAMGALAALPRGGTCGIENVPDDG